MPRHWLSLLTLVALTLLFVLLWEWSPKVFLPEKPEAGKADKYPTAFLTNTEIIQYNKQGSIDYQFNANRLEHFQQQPNRKSDKDYTEINQPYFILYEKDAPPWFVKAEYGHATTATDTLILQKNVHLWQTKKADEQDLELTTSKLILKPEDQYAETDKPVMIEAPGSTAHSVGMKADMKQGRIELLSRVRGVHEPIQKTP